MSSLRPEVGDESARERTDRTAIRIDRASIPSLQAAVQRSPAPDPFGSERGEGA